MRLTAAEFLCVPRNVHSFLVINVQRTGLATRDADSSDANLIMFKNDIVIFKKVYLPCLFVCFLLKSFLSFDPNFIKLHNL